jgi:hypothetical protein
MSRASPRLRTQSVLILSYLNDKGGASLLNVTDGLDHDWTPPEAADPRAFARVEIFKGVNSSFEMSIEC